MAQTHAAAKVLQMMYYFILLPSERDDPAYFKLQSLY